MGANLTNGKRPLHSSTVLVVARLIKQEICSLDVIGVVLENGTWAVELLLRSFVIAKDWAALSFEAAGKNYTFFSLLFQAEKDSQLCRSHYGSMLPLVFGLPFAPELKSAYPPVEGQQASLARKILTVTSHSIGAPTLKFLSKYSPLVSAPYPYYTISSLQQHIQCNLVNWNLLKWKNLFKWKFSLKFFFIK